MMNKRWLWLCFLFLGTAWAQSVGPVSITSNQCAVISLGAQSSTVAINVAGTWTGTLQPQITIQGQTAVNTSVFPAGSTTSQTTITANGAFTVSVAGFSTFQLCGNTVATGTATVYLNVSQASAKGSGGGGAPAFSAVTGGTNTAALVVGTGGSLGASGTGTITATNGTGAPTTPASPIQATAYLSPNCPAGNTGGCYYTPANTKVIQNCTFNTGTANVVCASGTFASTDVGKYIWGWATCDPFNSQPTATYITTTHNTISSYVSSTTVTMNAVGAAGSTTTGCVIFGSPDDTAAAAIDTAFASLATTPNCPKLDMAAGNYLFTTPHFFTNPVGCAAIPSLYGGGAQGNMYLAAGFEVEGRGPGAAIWWLPPDFPETGSCTNGNNTTSCFAVPLEGRFSNFQISSGNGKAGGTTIPNGYSIINVDVGSLDYFTCTGIADLQSGFQHTGVAITHWAQLQQVNISGCGDIGVSVAATAEAVAYRLSSENSNAINTSSANLYTSGYFTCISCHFYGTQSGAGVSAVDIAQNGGAPILKLIDTYINTGIGGSTNQVGYKCLTSTCLVQMDHDYFDPIGTTNSYPIVCGSGSACTISMVDTYVQAAGTGTPINLLAGSTLINRGNNTFTGGAASVNSGATLNMDSQGNTPITAAKAVLSANWGVSAAWSALNGGNSFTGTITNGASGTGAAPTITYTFPTPQVVNYIPFCQATQTGGTNATGTFAVSSVTATGAVFTYSLTPTASDTETVQIFCQ
jgi:hypothetical protein